MSIFFLVHMFASIIQVYLYKVGFWSRIPPKACNKFINIVLHSAWFVVTAPLFLKAFFGASELRNWMMV